MAVSPIGLFFFMVFLHARFDVIVSFTDPGDSAILRSLKNSLQNTPPSWDHSDDPCGLPWEGVTCGAGSRVTALGLSTLGIKGKLSGDIGGLTKLTSLDLSNNIDLTGPLTPRLGDLSNLNTLILQGCSFTGNIPDEFGNLAQLTFLALNTNNLTGKIPPSLGKLSKLYWLDLAENELSGSLPVSTDTTPGLDLLISCKHFHFNKNKLSGSIPSKLFSSDMVLLHLLFDANEFEGNIPESVGLVQTLEVLRMDRNGLSGPIPPTISNLTNLNELHLAQNSLSGNLPDLSQMNSLNYLDLSNNSFNASRAPAWFSTLQSLNTLVMEYGSLQGTVPTKLLGFPSLQVLQLRNNAFNGTLNIGGTNFSSQLKLIDLQSNQISIVAFGSSFSNTLMLMGNPVCENALSNTIYCRLQQPSTSSYSTSLANCGSNTTCPYDQRLSPQSCSCAYPLQGILYFRAPFFRDLSNVTLFHSLEMSLWVKLGLTPGSVYIQNPLFNTDDYLQVQLELFPSSGLYFNRSEVIRIGSLLGNQTFKPPPEFGPYFYIATPYPFPDHRGGTSISTGVIAGIAIGCLLLIIGLVGVALYAYKQKKRAEKAMHMSKPFASWVPNSNEDGGAPQLKGARWFSYDELKKSTRNFAEANEVGSGGYGKVYRGMLSEGQVVAIKRATQGSMQGGLEFKTEIELLSRVHHRNLVDLVGFCFEQGEQMLVYEFMANGTLRESLSGRSGIYLDWKRRLRIALGSARGLAYLHELANPPIIHRDVKSTNILLDERLTAKVADFGLSKLVSDTGKGHVSTQVKGTLGYLDPEYYMTQQLTDKSDVYSFGVVMLELVTARQPIEKGKYIVREVRMVMNTADEEYYGLKDLIDPTIRNAGNLVGFTKFVELAMQCVEESASDRPTMSDMVKYIEIMLQSDGINTNSTSAASSATEFKGTHKHPYSDIPTKEITESDAFDYSGGYGLSAKIEPK